MTRRVFLSDVHLEEPGTQSFLTLRRCLLAEAQWADEIFILGDLCETWIGDDDDAPLVSALADVLGAAAATVRLGFVAGNRDFLLGDDFARRTGMELVSDPMRLSDGVCIGHGDTLCTDDEPYQAMRTVVRSAQWRKDTLAKSLDERRAMGATLRAQSKEANANKTDNIMDTNAAAVDTLMKAHDAHTLIHGHTHRPGVHECAMGKRWVLGAWERCGWLVRQDADAIQLECFSLKSAYPGSGPL
ncbi:MAG: UDP-2,3-diacylglucosamine diphosphatase [Pseudomonadales bacterium]|nr:UDP-2,3-diacylglucosamine diphosphatase [Pseudomonadales bacterium]MDP6473134.1 UDP-2,3-diacylglucosamine diphosphatase [Pseudomonadales bacterium]MDP6826109.1 UDP-2,3-diacylglucosamine diphosphatase [Pseudomonadales bacterium]MDP6971515.1 UDP-2,3-diacylglucosamine diphosphatase [Pseudomonadales bacterium]